MLAAEPFQILAYVALAALGYLIGSLPTGALVARNFANVELTRVGSEHTGATNVARTVGIGPGLIVLACDFAKGMLAVWLARELIGTPLAVGLALLLSVVGHTRSVFLSGRGGRGVGTGLGGLAIAAPPVFIVAASTGCLVAALSRFVSLGSLSGAAMAIVASVATYAIGRLDGTLGFFAVLTAAVVIWAHADNIIRLRAGAERKIGDRAGL